MTAPAPHLTDLSADDRRQLESLLLKFDKSWDDKRLPVAARQLPADSPLRRPALIEMIKIDLERRWKAGQKVRLDGYLKHFPELGAADNLPVDLILAEYQVRRQFGTSPGLSDYAHRFPRQIEELRGRIQEADREATGPDVSGASTPTLRPAEAKHSTVPQAAGAAGATAMPEQFGRYRILKCLGRGGMGSVYLAHDAQLDRQVALKAPHFAPGDGPEVLERFAREARAAATLDHPNICPVYDVGVHEGVHYVTMAYVEGRPLSELVRDGKPLPPRPAAAVVRKLALALAEAHRHGVIHRDLKPANVMVNRRKEPVIMDFGLARRIDKDDQRLTKVGAILGTPAYMPPEQVSGDIEAMGPACDIYSLGVMLYEMLTGRPPFRGPLAAVLGQILTKQPEPPSKLRPDLDPALEAICLKAMAKKPEDRFASMDALAAALGRCLKGEAGPAKGRPENTTVSGTKGRASAGVKKGGPSEGTDLAENLLARLVDRLESQPPRASEPPPPPPPHLGAPWWIAPVAALAIVGGLLAAVFVAFVLFNRNPTITVSPTITNTNTVAVQLAGLTDRLNDVTVIFILDGKTVSKEQLSQPISLATGDHELVVKRGEAVIETRKFAVGGKDDKQTVQLPPPEAPGPAVAVRPPDGDNPKPPIRPKDPIILEGHTGAVTGLVFSPDGATLASGSNDNTIVLWDVAKGKERKTLNDKAHVSGVAFSPDGGTLASGRGDVNDPMLIFWDMQTYKKTMLKPTEGAQDNLGWVAFSPGGKLLAVQNTWNVSIWDLAAAKEIGKIEHGDNGSGRMAFSWDGALVAVPCRDSHVKVWETAARKEKVLEGHADGVRCVAFAPNGKTLASGSDDRTVKLWDLASGEVIDNLKGYDGPIALMQYTPDGKALVTGGGQWSNQRTNFKVWDVSGAQATELPKAKDLPHLWYWQIAPDSKTVALSYFDKVFDVQVVVLWDLYTGEERARAVVKQEATTMAFSTDGRWLAWGEDDGKVMLWEVGLKAPAAEKPAPPPGEPSTAVKAVLDALTDPDSNDVRRQAAESLKKLADKTAVGPLEERIADDLFKGDDGWVNPQVSSKGAAVDALKELAPERVTPALIRATHSVIEGVRRWACWELGTLKDKLKTKEGTDGLVAALKKDKAVAVRAEAARELATGRHSAVPALADALFDPENEVRFAAAQTLRTLGDRSANRPDAVKQVIEGAVPSLEKRVADDLFKGDDGWVNPQVSSKSAAVDALKELAPDRVTPALLGALAQEKNEDVRYWACWELGQQDDKESLDALAAASKADKSPKVREEALKAMTQRNK